MTTAIGFQVTRVGATVIAEREEFGHSFTVMADPEGNEFCVQ